MDRERVIFTSYHIVKIIFKHLDTRSLSKCAQVCSLWYRISVAEKERRFDIFWILKVGACQNIGTEREIDDKPFYDRENRPSSTNHSVMEGELFQALKNIPIQPVFCLSFMSDTLFRKFKEFFPSFGLKESEQKKQRFCEILTKGTYLYRVKRTAFKDFLPENCDITLIVAHRIVGCNANCVPMEIKNAPAISGVFIPEVEGVKINNIYLSGGNSSISKFIAENPSVKALIILSTTEGACTVDDLIQSYRLGGGIFNMAVGGALAMDTEYFMGSIVAFSGPNVEAASIIIDSDDKKEEITAKFETFKETGLLKHKCFALMFACLLRGYIIHGEKNEESTIFCKMYPKVPLIGMYGSAVIGYNYLPNFPMEKTLRAEAFTKNERKFLLVYSSVFVLISIKV